MLKGSPDALGKKPKRKRAPRRRYMRDLMAKRRAKKRNDLANIGRVPEKGP